MRHLQSLLIGAALVAALCFACGREDTRSSAAAEGEAAFWDTMYGVSDRADEAVTLLSQAGALNPQDGHSFFHLGMIHMFRFSQSLTSFYTATAAQKQELLDAQRALEAAIPLVPGDRRIPGFRAAATYMRGVITYDDSLRTTGLQQLREAIALYPEFNNFDFIGVVAPTVAPTDPLFAEVIQLVGDPLTSDCTPFTQPEICGNQGKAPHNTEGALVLFGDIFAKAGNRQKAAGYYRLAQTAFPTSGGPWRFQSLLQDRIATVGQRVAAYQDTDPTNDPLLIGYGSEACAVCHYK